MLIIVHIRPPFANPVTYYSDTNGTGFGGYCVEPNVPVVMDQWSEEEAKQSSTWLEVRIVHLVLNSICHWLKIVAFNG